MRDIFKPFLQFSCEAQVGQKEEGKKVRLCTCDVQPSPPPRLEIRPRAMGGGVLTRASVEDSVTFNCRKDISLKMMLSIHRDVMRAHVLG